uniref:Uncharacterized protein n=1 Tax=Oryza glaberrima TaxID=4538 RepID=I1Q5P7_ORYGL
ERGAVEKPLLHTAQRDLQQQRSGCAPEPPDVFPGVPVHQRAARRQAEPATGQTEDLPVPILTETCISFHLHLYSRFPCVACVSGIRYLS